jgi:hypothetical protein
VSARGVLGFLLLVVPAGAAHGQLPQLTGYYLNVGVASGASAFADANAFDFQRARLMTAPTYGAFEFDVAYEHLFTLRDGVNTTTLTGGTTIAASAGDFLPLQWTIEDSEFVLWRHRFDRLLVRYLGENVDATLGRQTVSWATTLYLTPADPFQPFDPSDPFREYRIGVDALRVRVFPGPLSQLDGVARLAEVNTSVALPGSEPVTDTTVTAVARGRVALGHWELSGWGGVVHDEASVSAAATVTVGGAAVRGEGVLRRSDGETVLRFTVGVDRSFTVARRNLYLAVEYQHDGWGYTDTDQLLVVATSPPALRGEMQVLGRHEFVALASFEIHPLVTTDLLGIVNVIDPSSLLTPSITYSVREEATVRAGFFLGVGAEEGDLVLPTGIRAPGSEYGPVPITGYASVTVFF